jgi:hypothetical protein
MLALAECGEVLGRNGPGKAELPRQTPLPFACDDPVATNRSAPSPRLLLAVGLARARGKWLGDCQHRSNARAEAEFTLALVLSLVGGFRHSALPVVSIAYGL